MAAEGNVLRAVWLAVARTTTLFRLNTGMAWISGLGPKGVRKLEDGSVHILQARPISVGFSKPDGKPVVGACDLPGWTEVVITPEMVGCRCAVFTSIECKRTTGGKLSEDQGNWMAAVQRAGGIAGVANSPEAARDIVADYHPPRANT
jgi:hypothetical protein